ncbi:MAG: hypothetical protein GPOALKHO_000269 [Sodalis sp.]|nr:MAG: hypothetical protein GPOALKHO_000269 [Sodalis sp.]
MLPHLSQRRKFRLNYCIFHAMYRAAGAHGAERGETRRTHTFTPPHTFTPQQTRAALGAPPIAYDRRRQRFIQYIHCFNNINN